MRLFAAVELPAHVTSHLATALAMVAPPKSARAPWDPEANWHVTLAFYGEQPACMVAELADNLAEAASRTPRFELSLAGAGVFRHEVCWIGVADAADALGPLARSVRGSYANPTQHTRNRFHVTIARPGRRSGLEDTMAAMSVYRGPAWEVEKITLFQSELGKGIGGHPLYTALAHADLAAM